MAWHTIFSLTVAIAVPLICSAAKRTLVKAEETQFYSSAEHAAKHGKKWKPHNKMRSMWPVVYTFVGVASWLVWREGGFVAQRDPLTRYACLLAANLLCWPPVFFGGHSTKWAFVDAFVLFLAAIMTIPKFYEVNSTAGLLLLPYIGWTCFASTLINCSLLSGNREVVETAKRVSAVKQTRPADPPLQRQQGRVAAPEQRRPSFSNLPPVQGVPRSILIPPNDGSRVDAATSPFNQPVTPGDHPLAQAKDLLTKMTAFTSSGNDTQDANSNEYLRSGLMRVNSLLSKVSGSIQGAAGALSDSRAPGPLSRMGSLLSRVSLSLSRAASQEDESLRWPTSDSIPTSFFSCPGAADYKVRGGSYLTDRKKIGPEQCTGRLVSLNLVKVKEPTSHIARFLPSIRDSNAPFIFVWQVMVPGKTHISLTVAWALDHDPVAAVKLASNRDAIPEDEVFDLHTGDQVHARESTSAQSTPQVTPHVTPRGSTGDLTAVPDTVRKPGSPPDLAVQHSSLSTSALRQLRSRKELMAERHRRSQSTVAEVDLAASLAKRESPRGSASSLVDNLLPSNVPAPRGASPFDVAMARFLDDSGTEAEVTARRHGMFKIIPRITEGGWIVKQAVGQNTPVLLGKKLTTKYFVGPRYLEVDVDVGSSQTAARVVGLVQGALKSLVIDIAVLLEGKSQEELPESLLGTVRLEHLDLSQAAVLDTLTGIIEKHQ